MNFIIDARLPVKLLEVFSNHHSLCRHVMELPKQDKTPDKEIRDYADEYQMVIVKKDFDFYHRHMSLQRPAKLLLVTTGNIKNKQLLGLFNKNLKSILKAFEDCHFVELSNDKIIVL